MAQRIAERFGLSDGLLAHELLVDGAVMRSAVNTDLREPLDDYKGAWWKSYLDGAVPSPIGGLTETLRAVDLFCGVGGLALGLRQLAAQAGQRVVTELIVDQDASAVDVYSANHDTRLRRTSSTRSLVDFRVRGWGETARFVYPPELLDQEASRAAQQVDLLMAGPPCQGHSNLNNRSRRNDKRNELYLTVPAFAVALGARTVIIENVPGVIHDSSRVVDTARGLLLSEGYEITSGVIAADTLGWPQTRRRFFMVARREGAPIDLGYVARCLSDQRRRSVLWAISTVGRSLNSAHGVLDEVTAHSPENHSRINWLFDNSAYDLPMSERPDCHQKGTTYNAVYGRMKPGDPAPTITTGFMSPGRGRFIHPIRRRTLTPREAAILQGFPSTYRFVTDATQPPTRSQLAKWIGDAVPMPLGYAAALSALGPEMPLWQRDRAS